MTLGSFSQAARNAATDTPPHVNPIDGEKIWEPVEKKGISSATRQFSTRLGPIASSDLDPARRSARTHTPTLGPED